MDEKARSMVGEVRYIKSQLIMERLMSFRLQKQVYIKKK